MFNAAGLIPLPCTQSDAEAQIQDITEMTQGLDDLKDLVRNSRKYNRKQKTYLLHLLDATVKYLYETIDTAINDDGDKLN